MIDRIYCGIAADTLIRRRYYKILAPLGTTPMDLAITLKTLDPTAKLVESSAVKDHMRLMFVSETIQTEEVQTGG